MEDGSIQQVDRDELLTALFALRKDLCRKGFDPGLQRVMAAHELLLEMAARGGPVNPAEWEGWLAPLFCSEAKQQDQFKEIFRRWIDRHREIFVGRQRLEPVSTPGTGRAVTDETIEPEGRKGDQSGRAEEKPARSRRIQRQVAAGAGLLLLTLFTGILWLDRTAEFRITGNVFDTVNKSPLSGAVVRVTGQAEVQSGPDGHYETVLKVSNYRLLKSLELEITATNSGYVDKTERRTLNRLNNRETQITLDFALQKRAAVVPLEPDKKTPGPAPPPTPSSRPLPKTESFLTVWDILLILSPLLLWLVWQILAALLRTWWLERVSSGVPPDLRTVPIEDPALELFASSQEQRSLVELRRPRPLDLHDLNLPDTVRKTARNAGIFTPTYQRLRSSPEYLLLIDRLGGRDEQARVGEGLLASLLRNGVYVQPYFFQGDPRLCQSIRRDDEQGPSVTLRYLAGRYPDSRLLLYSDVESFYDSTTGHPRPWLGQFDAWSQRALLTPKPPDRWGYREEGLREHQFSLLPVNSDGLRLLGDWLNYGHLPQPEIKPTIGFPPLVADRPERWIDREPPGEDVVAAMLSEVRSYLGKDGFLWLCACAIYPEVIWELTLAHGYWLFAARAEWSDGRAELILRLVRLPWFRHGYMPEWLRVKLVDHLASPENRKTGDQIRDNLEQLLLTAVKSPDKIVALEIAVPKRETLRERIRTHLRRLGMKLYLVRQDKREVLRDYVFLSFMTGRQANPPGIRLPELVKQIFFRDGKPWLGLRPVVTLIFALMMSGALALSWRTSKLPEVDPPELPSIKIPGPPGPPKPSPGSESAESTPNPPAFTSTSLKMVRTPNGYTVSLGLNGTLDLISLPGGNFMMGSENGHDDEKPVHQVEVQPFSIGRTEVTQAQWRAVMGSLPDVGFKGDDRPVESVSWYEAREFCRKLSALTGYQFRLPTEAEWEYAARGGTTTKYSFGDDEKDLDLYAWNSRNSNNQTHPVGTKLPNPFGLYDMHGNVWEWVEDHYHNNYQGAPTDGSAWLTRDEQSSRVLRGGSWYDFNGSRSASRNYYHPDYRDYRFGFRVVVGAQTQRAR